MKTVIWPVYLDSTHTRGQGRKLSKEQSVKEPKLREISQALRKSKIQHIVDHSKSYPASWWEKSGCVIVDQEEKTKMELIRLIASTINRSRRN
ncbi:MAG: signal recognition particle subunit SRP19/SEC65 family protein [Methanosphaera sp.]|nr:signal recognition particle subunit SRP19/SEC65 family protein [Methanosphaera sp.]